MNSNHGFSSYWEADTKTLQFAPVFRDRLSRFAQFEDKSPFSWRHLLIGDANLESLKILETAARLLQPFGFEARVKLSTGELRWIRVVGDAPSSDMLRGFITDITDEKHLEIDAEARYRELFEGIPSPVVCYDWYSRRILNVNSEAIKHYGYSKAEFLNLTVDRLWPSDVAGVMDQKLSQLDPAKPSKTDWIHITKDGRRINVEVVSHVVQLEGQAVRVAVVNDVTVRRQIEQELRLFNERLIFMTSLTGTVIGSLPLVEQAKTTSEQVCKAFQVDACVIRLLRGDELVLLASSGIEPELLTQSIPAAKGLASKVIEVQSALSIPEASLPDPGQPTYLTGYRFLSYAGAPLMVKDQIIGVIAIYTDREKREFSASDLAHLQIVANNVAVSVLNDELYEQVRLQKVTLEKEIMERIRVEDALTRYSESLRESEERLRLVTDASTDGIWVWDRDTDTITWSDRVYDLLGLDRTIQGANLNDALAVVHPDDRRNYLPALVRHIRKEGPYRTEMRLRRGDNTYGRYQVYCMLARDLNQRVVRMVGSLHDITEKVQRDREMEAVAAISFALREVETTEEMLPIISEQIARILDLQSVGLALVDPETDVVVIRHVSGVFQKLVGVRFEKNQGLVGRVFGDAVPKFDPNIMNDPTSIMRNIIESPTAVLGVPLVARGDVIGVLWLGKPYEAGQKDVEFTAGESRLLSILAEIAAASLRRVALRERTEFHLQRLHSLSIIHATVSENLNLRTMLDMLLEQLKSQTKIDAAAIHLFDEATTSFKLETTIGFETGTSIPSLGRDLIVNRYRSKLVHLQEAGARGRRFGNMIAAGFESYLAVPLIANENILGVLEIYHRTELPQDVDLDNFAEMLASQAAIAVDNTTLLRSLRTANRELISAYDATIEGWSRALDLRDHETEGHSRRVTDMTVELAKLVGVPAGQISDMRRGALLHDIGKMAIPDSVLHKPGELDQNELVIMRRHPGIALDLLEPVKFLRSAIDIPFCHHERWDGSGYPRGLKGEEIPLPARIFAVVDVWDALRSDRPYRKRWSTDQAVHYIKIQSGRQFDPEIVEIFLENLKLFEVWNQ